MTNFVILGLSEFFLPVFGALIFISSLFLILLVLVQRGKGGGLTGALGGMGGQSAFGSRAGDAFTKITVVLAVFWITLNMLTIAFFNPPPRPKTALEQAETRSGMGATDNGEEAIDESSFNPNQNGEPNDNSGDANPVDGNGTNEFSLPGLDLPDLELPGQDSTADQNRETGSGDER